MPNIHNEIIYTDTDDKIFAKRLTKKTTTWFLRELMEAADVPSDVEITGSWHYDDYGDEMSLSPEHAILKRVQYFDEQGREVREVRVEKQRTLTQTYYETKFEVVNEVQTPNEGREAESTAEEVASAG